jgi:hypothetical protein
MSGLRHVSDRGAAALAAAQSKGYKGEYLLAF